MSAVVRRDWRALRRLLQVLGLVALVYATLSLTDPRWMPAPPPWGVVAYIGAPAALGAAAAVVARRTTKKAWRVAAIVVATCAAIAVVANTALVVMLDRWGDELEESLGETCGPRLVDCGELLATAFGSPQPRVPTIEQGDGYHFARGDDFAGAVSLWYEADGGTDGDVLVYAIVKRSPERYEPPVDPAGYLRTPGGTSYLERRGDAGVTALDFWDDAFHYVVSLNGAHAPDSERYAQAIALVDSARE